MAVSSWLLASLQRLPDFSQARHRITGFGAEEKDLANSRMPSLALAFREDFFEGKRYAFSEPTFNRMRPSFFFPTIQAGLSAFDTSCRCHPLFAARTFPKILRHATQPDPQRNAGSLHPAGPCPLQRRILPAGPAPANPLAKQQDHQPDSGQAVFLSRSAGIGSVIVLWQKRQKT